MSEGNLDAGKLDAIDRDAGKRDASDHDAGKRDASDLDAGPLDAVDHDAPDRGAGPLAAAPAPASALRMIASLGGAGALAGLLIVAVFNATKGPIADYKAEVLERAVGEVLHDPARHQTLFATPRGVFDSLAEAGAAPGAEGGVQKIYVGYDERGRVQGVAIEAAAAGFQDVITLLYGFDPATGRLLGMKVLESKETPGLGDRIEKDLAFVAQFAGAAPPLEAVKRATGASGEIDAITGATISSRAVVRIINQSISELRAPIEARFQEPRR